MHIFWGGYINNSLIVSKKSTSNELYELEKTYLDRFSRHNINNPSLTLHASMVYGFAHHLPYSMDIMQDEYVPGDFLNFEPFDVDTNPWFKWDDRRTMFNAMVSWGDTFKSGVIL